jgi:cytosine/adenosine deaminase-related metal-dependent hydrolase
LGFGKCFLEFYSMAFLKFRAKQLFNGFQILGDHHVLITTTDGTVEDVVQLEEAGDGIIELPGILSPGLVNCHCHLELSHMKGHINEGTGLIDFVTSVVSKRHFPEEEILAGIKNAEDEMLRNGIVAAGDICNNILTVSQKSQGRIWYHNFIEASGFDPLIAEQRFQRSLEIFQEYGRLYSIPIESNSIVPHAPYSVADALWEKILHFPGNNLLTIHNQETMEEDEWFRTGKGNMKTLYQKMNIDTSSFIPSGKSSLQSWLVKFLRYQSVILVHNVYTSEADVAFARSTGKNLYWCLCPNANLYISQGLPDVEMLMENNCTIVLGTDSLASNHELNIVSEMKVLRNRFPGIHLDELLRWGTINGARALHLDKLLGSFEKDKKPGVIVVDPELNDVRRII